MSGFACQICNVSFGAAEAWQQHIVSPQHLSAAASVLGATISSPFQQSPCRLQEPDAPAFAFVASTKQPSAAQPQRTGVKTLTLGQRTTSQRMQKVQAIALAHQRVEKWMHSRQGTQAAQSAVPGPQSVHAAGGGISGGVPGSHSRFTSGISGNSDCISDSVLRDEEPRDLTLLPNPRGVAQVRVPTTPAAARARRCVVDAGPKWAAGPGPSRATPPASPQGPAGRCCARDGRGALTGHVRMNRDTFLFIARDGGGDVFAHRSEWLDGPLEPGQRVHFGLKPSLRAGATGEMIGTNVRKCGGAAGHETGQLLVSVSWP